MSNVFQNKLKKNTLPSSLSISFHEVEFHVVVCIQWKITGLANTHSFEILAVKWKKRREEKR